MIVLLASLHTTLAITATVCDCSNERKDGFIAFEDEDCLLGTEDPSPPTAVTYTLYSHLPEVKRFPGHVCRMWAVTKSVFTDFLGWHYPTESKWAIPVSTAECEEMRDLRRCKNETMYAKGAHKYAYDVMPPLQPVWMATRRTHSFHCKIAEVALESECDNCTINSPVGSIEYPYNGTVTRNLQTLIWEDAYKEQKPCDLKIVGEPTFDAFLYKTRDAQVQRIQDRVSQTDYLVNITTELEFCGKSALFRINGMDKILIAINVPPPKLYASNDSSPGNVTGSTVAPLTVDTQTNGSYTGGSTGNVTDKKVPDSLAGEIQLAGHQQYTRDEATDQINRLAGEIRRLQCENRKATRNHILLSAKSNGWHAATQLHLPLCSQLTVYGSQVEVSRCRPFNVTFGVERTKCGYQPRFLNFTLAHNGWTLATYQACYWPEGNYVNFNGKTHIHADGDWVPVITTVPLNNRQLAGFATYEADNSLQNFLQLNPAMQNGPLSHESVMADILATIHEHYAEDNSRQLLTSNVLIQHSAAPNIDFVTKIGGWVKNFGAVSGLGALSVIAVRFCGIGSLLLKFFPIFAKFLKFTCFRKSPPAITAAPAALPMSIIVPPTAVTGQSISTGAPSATVPPRRTRPRQPRPQHTTQEVEVFLPRRARSQPRRVV